MHFPLRALREPPTIFKQRPQHGYPASIFTQRPQRRRRDRRAVDQQTRCLSFYENRSSTVAIDSQDGHSASSACIFLCALCVNPRRFSSRGRNTVTPLRFSRRGRKESAEIAECLNSPPFLRLSRELTEYRTHRKIDAHSASFPCISPSARSA